jgi:hypothetical protein
LLRDDEPQHRYEIATTLLDELRRNLAIEVRCLTEDGFDEIRRLSAQHLTETWGLGLREQATVAQTAYPRPSGKGSPRSHLHLSGRGHSASTSSASTTARDAAAPPRMRRR